MGLSKIRLTDYLIAIVSFSAQMRSIDSYESHWEYLLAIMGRYGT